MNKTTKNLPIAKKLGVAPKKVIHYLTKALGEQVNVGETIAEKKGFLGFTKQIVESPIDGKLVSFNEDKGEVVIEGREEQEKKEGKKKVKKEENEFEGVFGFGKAEGEVIVIEETVTLKHIQKGIEDKVMVCKKITGKGVPFKLEALGGKGLIIAEAEDLQKKELEKEVQGKVDLGIIVIEEDLNEFKDKKVLIDGKRRRVCVLS